jgi:ornithine cyclodeaminase/alanine dehydrogenase-like protein (mu-crystallin family)
MKILDFDKIKSLNLSAEEMYSWTENVWKQQDSFILPPKSKMLQGENGRYFTMPCVLPQYDISGVKFICRNVDDVDGVPARNSNIMLQNCSKHGLLAVMDGTYI